jgi:hypothetical protein
MRSNAGNGLFLSRHFQNAYTTRDIDAAAKMFADRYDVRSFHYMRDVPNGNASMHLGLAWAGDVMVELIQPNGDIPLYSSHMPPDGQLVRFHHLGHLIDDRAEYDAVVARATASGYPIALHGNNYGINYLYLDVRSDAGHFLEYVHLDPPMTQFFAPVPRN